MAQEQLGTTRDRRLGQTVVGATGTWFFDNYVDDPLIRDWAVVVFWFAVLLGGIYLVSQWYSRPSEAPPTEAPHAQEPTPQVSDLREQIRHWLDEIGYAVVTTPNAGVAFQLDARLFDAPDGSDEQVLRNAFTVLRPLTGAFKDWLEIGIRIPIPEAAREVFAAMNDGQRNVASALIQINVATVGTQYDMGVHPLHELQSLVLYERVFVGNGLTQQELLECIGRLKIGTLIFRHSVNLAASLPPAADSAPSTLAAASVAAVEIDGTTSQSTQSTASPQPPAEP